MGGGKIGLEGYSDADGASQEHRRAMSGYAFIMNGGCISWSSRKQELITLSTAEAEYVATTHAAKEAIWLRNFIGEIFTPFTNPTVRGHSVVSVVSAPSAHSIPSLPSLVYIPPHRH